MLAVFRIAVAVAFIALIWLLVQNKKDTNQLEK
jgi:hypothetical protein